MLTVPRATYNNAQKMRAAISHKFGRDHGLGTQPWMENPGCPGKFIGNPSLSVTVSQYMISLRRRKVSVCCFSIMQIQGTCLPGPCRWNCNQRPCNGWAHLERIVDIQLCCWAYRVHADISEEESTAPRRLGWVPHSNDAISIRKKGICHSGIYSHKCHYDSYDSHD
jgi:hypothetical protein